ncbi:MAG: restriction endonuclease [Clostridiales bacterium]|nr:restriction endonuclease [Clostridiales bacterium]
MAERTFGWVQEAYKISNLKRVIKLFLLNSDVNKELRIDKIPRLVPEKYGRDEFIRELSKERIHISYQHLKGKGTPKGYTRSNAPCSGIVQAALPGQRKEYQSDWSADSYLRWGVSVGLLEYDRNSDECSLSELGEQYVHTEDGSKEEEDILEKAFLSYPPVCRIMLLLESNVPLTKFEIGEKLGFIGEAGFTSIPQHLILQGLSEINDARERNKLLSDTEGTSDKYARTICSWLKQLGWVTQVNKTVTTVLNGIEYSDMIAQSYQITLKGLKVIKHIKGTSKFAKIPKRVMWDMLATKVTDRDYLRNRRTHLLNALQSDFRSLTYLQKYLKTKGISESESTIADDINSFENIGLSVVVRQNQYKVTDTIVGLSIPAQIQNIAKSDFAILKDDIRKKLQYVNHKYLLLIDLGFDSDSNRDYEIQTAELLTTELDFKGARLGDTRKPDVCVYYGKNGLIIDNKAYSKGYSLPMSQADEMVRYIEENKTRQSSINPNQWWKIFEDTVCDFNYAFVSGEFTGGFKDRLDNICERTGVRGVAINTINLLLLAEELKSGRMEYPKCFSLFNRNDEIKFSTYEDTIYTIPQSMVAQNTKYGD